MGINRYRLAAAALLPALLMTACNEDDTSTKSGGSSGGSDAPREASTEFCTPAVGDVLEETVPELAPFTTEMDEEPTELGPVLVRECKWWDSQYVLGPPAVKMLETTQAELPAKEELLDLLTTSIRSGGYIQCPSELQGADTEIEQVDAPGDLTIILSGVTSAGSSACLVNNNVGTGTIRSISITDTQAYGVDTEGLVRLIADAAL